MLVSVLGTPTSFGYWGFSLVGHILDAVYGAHLRIHCLDVDGLRAGWRAEKDRPVVVTSDRPDTPLSYLLITSNFPVLAFLDDPRDALANAIVFDKLSPPDAVRFCTQYVSCLAGCTGAEQVRLFGSDWRRESVAELAAAVAAAIGLPADAGQIAASAQRATADVGLGAEATVEEVMRRRLGGQTLAEIAASRFDAQERALTGWFDADYGPFLIGRERDAITWPLDLFSVETKGAAAKDVELIGSSRHIVWGPYLHLPVGGWRARVHFETAGNLSGNEIEGDVCTENRQVVRCNAKLPVQGYFEFTLDFAVANPNSPIELRIRVLKGAIEGRFALRSVTLQPVADVQGPAAGQFESLLKSLA